MIKSNYRNTMGLLLLILWDICIFACYYIAEKNGRNPVLATILGLLFGVFAVAGYTIAGKKD